MKRNILIFVVLILVLVTPVAALAISSENFYEEKDEVFDEWDLCRTRSWNQDGFFQVVSGTEFRPAIVFESLGDNAGIAYRLGQEFAQDYPDFHQRAERIFAFARDKVSYRPDAEQFGFGEFAQNADELATTIAHEGFAYGDCEDYAILLAVMYKGAGYRSAAVLAPEHAAVLVHLPEYKKASRSLSLDGESGWVWAEATGGNNPLGWLPERYMGAQLAAYEVTDEAIALAPSGKSSTVVTPKGDSTGIHISPFFGVILFMGLISLFRRRRR